MHHRDVVKTDFLISDVAVEQTFTVQQLFGLVAADPGDAASALDGPIYVYIFLNLRFSVDVDHGRNRVHDRLDFCTHPIEVLGAAHQLLNVIQGAFSYS